jgi:hypothetical protein
MSSILKAVRHRLKVALNHSKITLSPTLLNSAERGSASPKCNEKKKEAIFQEIMACINSDQRLVDE